MELNLRTQWYVGLFIIVGLFLVLVSIFILGADRSFFRSYMHYKVHFDQVQGLNKGSVISLSGINIGNVEDIYFLSGTNDLEVLMRVEKSYARQITKGTQVEIKTQGALGDKFMFVIPGPATNEILKDGEALTAAKATDLIGVISERGKETEKLFDIIDELYKMTKVMNAENRLDKMLNNMADTATNLKEITGQTRRLTTELTADDTHKQLKSSIVKLDHILTKIDKGQGTLGALINDSSLHTQLKSLLGGSQRKQHIKSIIRTSIEKSAEVP